MKITATVISERVEGSGIAVAKANAVGGPKMPLPKIGLAVPVTKT